MLDKYKDPLEYSKTPNTMTHIAQMVPINIQTLIIDRLPTEQKKDIHFRNLAAQSFHKNKNSFNMVIISPELLLRKQQYVPGLNYAVTRALHSVAPVILHELLNSKGQQGTIHTFDAIRRFYWWPKLCQDIVKHINKCYTCAKNLPNMAKYPQQHLEIPHIQMVVLAMDIIGCLPVTCKGH